MDLMTRLALETPLPNLEVMKSYIVAAGVHRGEDAGMVERRFHKSTFHTQLKLGIRQRPTEIRSSQAWARGFMTDPAAFNTAAEDGLDGFGERLLEAAPETTPLSLFFGLKPEVAATWTHDAICTILPNPLLKRASAFVQTISAFDMPFDTFQRLSEVRSDYSTGSAMNLLNTRPTATLTAIVRQLDMVKGPRRDALAWLSLDDKFTASALVEAIPFLVAANCSPAEAFRLSGLGTVTPMACAHIVGHDVPDEYVATYSASRM